MYNTEKTYSYQVMALHICGDNVTMLAGKGFEIRGPCSGNRFLEGEVQGLIRVSTSCEDMKGLMLREGIFL